MQEKTYKVVDGTAYDSRTPDDLVSLLEKVRRSGTRVRIFYGDVATGQVWDEATPLRGTIGRSTGTYKIPLVIKTARSVGGESVLDYCILQLRAQIGGTYTELWSHPVLQKAA